MIGALCCRLTNRLIDWSPRGKLKKAQEKPDSDECFSPVMGNINMIHSVRTNKCIHKENGGVGGPIQVFFLIREHTKLSGEAKEANADC